MESHFSTPPRHHFGQFTGLFQTCRLPLGWMQITSGLQVSPAKPPMDILLSPVLRAIRKLASTGLTTQTVEGEKVVMGKLLVGVFDLPAKASAANMKQYNGEYGCTYCTDKGVLIARNTRIYPPSAPHRKRTSLQMDQWVVEAESQGCAVMGVHFQHRLIEESFLCIKISV